MRKIFRKKFLILLSIFLLFIVFFFFGPSFSNFIDNQIPSCSCINEGKTIIEHTDECEMKNYYRNLSKNSSAEDLVNKWDSFSDEEKAAVEEFMSIDDPIKKIEFDNLIDNQKVSLVTTNVDDGAQVLVQGDIPKGTVVDAVLTEQEKISVISDKNVGIVDNNITPERTFTYDISLEKNSKDVSSDVDDAVITIANIGASKDKVYKVYHLLDEADAISSGISSDSVKKVTSNSFGSLFSKEVEAAGTVSSDSNSIYVKSFEATVNSDGSISFSTDSFSTFYVIEYTVDFHYNGLTYNMPGDSSMLLSQLFAELKIDKNVNDVVSVEFSDADLLEITRLDNGDWQLTSLGAFKTIEKLTMVFSDNMIIELEVTDSYESALQTSNNDVKIGTTGIYTVYQIFGTLYPEINALYSRTTGSRNHIYILQNADGTQVATASVSHVAYGTNFTFSSDTWWFTATSSMDISETDTSINHFRYEVSTFASMKDIIVKRYPRVTYNNSNVCIVKQRSVFSANATTRIVYIYVNNGLISNSSYQFPTRGGVDASYIDVTYDSSKYQMTKSVVDSSNYRVDLNAIANLVYDANDGSGAPASQKVVYVVATTLSTTVPTRTGYTFKGWSESKNGSVKYAAGASFTSTMTNPGDTKTLYAVWEGNTVNYTINHYKQNLDGSYPSSPSASSTKSGKVGDMTTASANTYEGFTANSFSQVSIGVSGATVNIYYTRNSYSYTIYHKDKEKGITISDATTGNALYGASLNISDFVEKTIENYSYDSSSTDTLTISGPNNTATIYYLRKTANYTVNYYLQNIDDNNYTLYSSEEKTGYVGDTATWSEKTIAGAYLREKPENTSIAENGSTVINVYYNRNVYTVSYSYTGSIPTDAPILPAESSYRYGKKVSVASAPTMTGYKFSGWSQVGTITITDKITITGSWIPENDAFYKVNYCKKGTTGESCESETVENLEYGKSYTVTAKKIPGYNVDGSSSKAVTAGYSNNEISFYYNPSSDTKYYVYYYKQGLDGGFSDDPVKVEKTGTTDTPASYVELTGKDSVGFTFRKDMLEYNYENINGDSENDPTIIKVYYERNKYTFTWEVTKSDDSSYLDTGYKEYYYGQTIDEKSKPTMDGYTFYGWEITPTLDKIPGTMPAYNISISGELVRDLRNLVIKKDWPNGESGQAIFLVEGDGLSIEVVVDGNTPAIVKDLPLGEEYTITEIEWPSNYKPADPIKKVIDNGDNTVLVSSEFKDFNWFSSKSLKRNVFGKR